MAERKNSPDKINTSFSGHETFPFRYTWLKKGFDAVSENPLAFADESATVTLGVGKNMVRSIRHWCLATGLIKKNKGNPDQDGTGGEGLAPTKLGKSLLADDGFDPYLEDVATLWLIHWQLATNRDQATTWFWAFSIFGQNEFRKDRFISELIDWAQKTGKNRISENSIKRDVDCLLRTYIPSRLTKTTIIEDTFDCPLVELNLISDSSDGDTYRFHRGPKDSLPTEIFVATLSKFWDDHFSGNNELAFVHIAYSPNSPGQVFKLDEDTLVEYLDSVEELTGGALRYDETAGVKQVYRDREIDWMEHLRRYYKPVEAMVPQSNRAPSGEREWVNPTEPL